MSNSSEPASADIPHPSTDDAAAAHRRWREERVRVVTAPAGNLALVDFLPVGEDAQEIGLIPATVRREAGEEGLRVSAEAADGVLLDGAPVDGEVFWPRLRADGTSLLTWRGITADAFSLDGADYEVRLYDVDAPARADFIDIECFDYDPAFAVPATFVPRAATETVAWEYTRASDAGATKQVPGVLRFDLAGHAPELTGFLDGSILVVTFADATTGKESHAPGRFLKVPMPAGTQLLLDFNEAFIPPCGFSDSYSCPLPPAENRLSVPVSAGERHVRWRSEAGH